MERRQRGMPPALTTARADHNPNLNTRECQKRRLSSHHSLSLVLLDDLGWPKMSVGRIAAEFLQGAALAQQVPILVELDLDFLQPLLIGIGRGTMLIEALLFRHQFPNVVEHR